MKKTISARVSPATAAEVEQIAREEWLTVSQVVERAVTELVERRRRKAKDRDKG